jgi:hypothetical protein
MRRFSCWWIAAVPLAGLGCHAGSGGEVYATDHSADLGASGYCRTTTCQPALTSDYPIVGQCQPADFADSPECRALGASNAPLWWSTSCVGYDLNELASRKVSYDDFQASAQSAFGAWTAAACPSRPSVDVRDLGPVACARAFYDKTGGPNQNVIVFHDDAWPYEAADDQASGQSMSTTIALTTVTFDPQTGEIFDADIELNSADFSIVIADPSTPSDGTTFDLQSVLTHETGHFFGLAHSPLEDAVMYKTGDSNAGTAKRSLAREDALGICAVYTPTWTRTVSTIVDDAGTTPAGACDPTPRHGFSSTCD